MGRLVDYGFSNLNAAYDALPMRAKLAIICGRFDEWVRGNGSVMCSVCKLVIREIGAPCPNCNDTACGHK